MPFNVPYANILLENMKSIELANRFILLQKTASAVDFCSDPNVLKAMRIIGTVITIIKIVVPVILVVMAMIKLLKAVIGDEDYADLIKNLFQKFGIAVLIFFIPSIVGAILNNIGEYTTISKKFTQCTECFTSSEGEDCKSLINTATIKYEAKLKAEEERVKNERQEAIDKVKKEQEENRKKAALANSGKASSGGVSNPYNIPYYSQGVGTYRTITLSDGSVYPNYNCGCGFTSLAMVIDGLSGQRNTPYGVINYFNPHSYAANFCPIYDSTLINSQIKSHFGVTPNVLFPRSSVSRNGSDAQARKQTIVNSLQSGHAIVVLVPGHYITLAGIKDGLIIVLDPANSANNGGYTIDNLWEKFYNHKNRCNSIGACGMTYAVEYSR